jgi:YVTN family beta-propeller protein
MSTKSTKFFLFLIAALLVSLGIGFVVRNIDKDVIVYIPNAGDGTISVVDTKNSELIDTIKIGPTVSDGIASTPGGKKIYLGSKDGGQVLVYDTARKEIVKTIDTGRNVHGIDITPDGKFVFVASGALKVDDEFDYIQIIDTRTDEIVKVIKSGGNSPSHIDFSSDSKFAFVSNVMSNNISVVSIENINKAKVLYNIDVGIMPNELEPSPDNKLLYVANVQDGSISVVDVKKAEEVRRIKADAGTHGVAVSKDGNRIWTTNRFSNSVSVIDVVKGEVIKNIKLEGEPNHVLILPDGKYAYVTSLKSNDLTIIDTNTYDIIKQIGLGKDPHEMDLVKM